MARVANSGATDVGICEGTTYEADTNASICGPVVLVEVDFPGGTQYFSTAPLRFMELFAEGRILSVGSIRRSLQQNLGLFESSSVEVVFADGDQYMINLSASEQIKGVTARVKLGTRRLPYSEFRNVFEGLIDDFGADNFTFRLLIRDRLFNLPPQPETGKVNTDDFPYALPADVGKPLPVCYGSHSYVDTDDPAYPDSSDFTFRGAWPTLYVDTRASERTFLIARHAVKSIDKVYAYKSSAGSQELTLTTDYVPYIAGTLNGETMAFVKLTSAGFAKLVDTNALGVLTANVEGKESAGDGTGTLITNPIEVLNDFLALYCGNPPIDGDAFDTAKDNATDRNYSVRGGYTIEQNTDEVLRDIANSFQVRIYPNASGKIAVNMFVPSIAESDNTAVREYWEILKDSFQLNYVSDFQGAQDAQVINYIDYSYKYHFAKQTFLKTDTVSNQDSINTYGEKKLVYEMKWAKDSTTGGDVSSRIINLYKQPVAHFSCTVPLLGANIDLTEIVNVTHGDGPSGGYDGRGFEILEHILDLNSLTVGIRGKDVETISAGGFFLGDESAMIKASTGTASVTDTSQTITITSGPGLVSSGVVVGDIIRLYGDDNISEHEIQSVAADSVEVDNSTWTNESGMTYDIIPSWETATEAQQKYGFLCDDTTGLFDGGDDGPILL